MGNINLKVMAKINLSLGIKGVDDRGYHDLDMLLLSVSDIYDVISVTDSDSIKVTMNGKDCDDRNTAYKALKIIKDTYGITMSADVEKNIPFSAGLGGSSCDAAGVFCAFSKLHKVRCEELYPLADKVGSDVVFMMRGGAAISRGQGSDLTFVELPSIEVMVMKAKGGSNTGKVFAKYDEVKTASNIDNMVLISRIKQNKDYSMLLQNVLFEPASALNPEIKRLYDEAKKVTDYVVMSGSGSSIVAVINNESEKARLTEIARSAEWYSITHTAQYGVESYSKH